MGGGKRARKLLSFGFAALHLVGSVTPGRTQVILSPIVNTHSGGRGGRLARSPTRAPTPSHYHGPPEPDDGRSRCPLEAQGPQAATIQKPPTATTLGNLLLEKMRRRGARRGRDILRRWTWALLPPCRRRIACGAPC